MDNINMFGEGREAALENFEMIDRKPSTDVIQFMDSIGGRLENFSISFWYPSYYGIILKNFSLVISKGRGSGKATLSLIERSYEPSEGEIRLDGYNLKTLNVKWLRHQIGLLSQEPAFLATIVAANFAFDRNGSIQAVKVANGDAFKKAHPLGYHSQMSDYSVQLPEPENQRLAVSRAFVKKPATLLMLDGPSSTLDVLLQEVVEEPLDSLMMGKTTVLVRRQFTFRNAACIALMEDNQILKLCTRGNLMRSMVYSGLVRQENEAASAVKKFTNFAGQMLPSRPPVRKIAARIDINDEAAPMAAVAATWLMALTRKNWNRFLGVITAYTGNGCLQPIMAMVIAEILTTYFRSSGREKQLKGKIESLSMLLVILGCITSSICFLQHLSTRILGGNLVQRVRTVMLCAILKSKVEQFDETDPEDDLMGMNLVIDVNNMLLAFIDGIFRSAQNYTLMLFACVVATVLQRKIAIVMGANVIALIFADFLEEWVINGLVGALPQYNHFVQANQAAREGAVYIKTAFRSELEGKINHFRHFCKEQVARLLFGVAQWIVICAYAVGLCYTDMVLSTEVAQIGVIIKVILFTAVCVGNEIEIHKSRLEIF